VIEFARPGGSHVDQYFLVSSSGEEYGPTDLPGLLQWARDGRVLRQTLIRKAEATPVPAATLPELAAFFATPPPISIPPFVTVVELPAEFRSWDFIESAWELVRPHWIPLGAIFFITIAITAVPYLGPCVFAIIGGAIYVGINRAILGMLAGKAPTVGMMFEGFDRVGQAFLANVVVSVLVGFGIVLCIVPGVILGLMWMFVSLILAETDLDFWPAMKASADLTSGYRWELFCLMLANLVVILIGILACCVGILLAQPVVMTSMALAYRFLQTRQAGKTA
jgi:uncharacterized membrane protein